MRTRHTVWVLTVLAVALMPGLLEARERGPRRFSNYKQIARALKQPQFAAAYGALDRRVGLALGQPEVAMADVLPAAAAAADAVAGEATGTNTQVAGVDEADLVKSDGTYLYLVTNGRLAVVRAARALPGGETAPLELVSLVDLGDDSFVPSELHLYGSLVVVVGMSYDYSFLTDPPVEAARVASLMPIWAGTARTVLRIYDVSVPEEPSLVRELEVEGTHLASRRIGQYLYVLARAYPWLDAALETRRRAAAPGLVPKVGDSLDEGSRDLRPGEVSCLPGCYEASYLVVAAVDLASAEGEFVPHAFLGGGNLVYASATNLYVAASSWFWRPMLVLADDGTVAETPEQETVTLFRFELDGTNVRFAARGSAPGRVLNQFGMDEHEGVFRIATTFYPNVWTDAAETSGVYTYDLGFGRLGAIEGLAPGERIYAARFLGDRCYLVTFETIDPLFVIDLADPAAPAVLGELEVPGYSAYLHPVGPNHLIGLGKDVQMVQTPWSGEEGVPMEQGLKLALFDVTDVTQPVEVDAELIGVRGSHSEALYDHHAFLYDAERQLVAFPCTIREFIDPPDPEEFWWWGDFVFQGVVAYGLDLATGFERRGAVTHMEEGTVEVWDAPWERTVRRALVAGELLHTVSEGMVKANDTATMAERSALRLPWDEVPVDDPLVYWLDPGTAGEVSGDPILDWSEAAPPADGLLGPTRIPNAAAAVGELLRGYLEARR